MVQFNQIPGNLVAPIFAFEISSAGQFENQGRLLLIGHKNGSVATMTDNVPVPCPSKAEARALAGAGSLLDEMYRLARDNAPAQEIWIMSAPATGTAEIRTITVDTVPADGGAGSISIAGEIVSISIAAGATDDEVAAALASAINDYYNPLKQASLPYTASATEAVVTVTARHAGAYATEYDFHVPVLTGVNAFTGNLTVAVGTAGAGTPDVSAALAATGDDPFDWVVTAFGDDTNLTRYKDWLNETSGRWAWNRQIYGHVFYGKLATTGDLTTHGLAQDNRHVTAIPQPSGAGYAQPSWQWAAGQIALLAPWLSDGATGNVSRAHSGRVVQGLDAPRDRSKWLDYATRDAFLKAGLSTWFVNSAGQVCIDKIITTQRTVNGVTDTTFRDIQSIGQAVYALRRFRAALTYEHGQKALADDNPQNIEVISTPADIKATFIHTYAAMPGVLENVNQAAAVIRVERNGDNPNRVDILAPLDRLNALDIVATNARFYSQFNSALTA